MCVIEGSIVGPSGVRYGMHLLLVLLVTRDPRSKDGSSWGGNGTVYRVNGIVYRVKRVRPRSSLVGTG